MTVMFILTQPYLTQSYNLNLNSPCVSPRACSQCLCSAENPACRDKPFTILYRHMDLSSGRSVPADIFQMQATTRYPGAFYIFQIKSGNQGREFYMRVSTSGMNMTQAIDMKAKEHDADIPVTYISEFTFRLWRNF